MEGSVNYAIAYAKVLQSAQLKLKVRTKFLETAPN